MPNTPSETSTLSYEDAMLTLEQIVTKLESGKVSLDESLQLVQQGRDLSAHCTRLLDEAELALTQLVATPEGELAEETLEWDEDE